jgi:hypothetical protein
MSAKSLLFRLSLVGMIVVIGACAPAAKTDGEPPAITAPAAISASASAAPNAAGAPTAAAVSNAAAAPSAAPAPEDDEMACRALCHIPDPNEFFGVGAKRQPPSHQERTTCLECHAAPPTPVAATTPAAPAVPATHLGRQNAACVGCHLTK